ncbi:TT1751-like protein [Peniophora sp. CONT]|nr:TT1751-like protein [Peniophora sp. CONT]
MSKTIEDFTVQRVQYTTDLPVYEVLKRMDAAVNRDSEKNIVRSIRAARTPKELELRVKEVAGDNFGFFFEFNHSNWLKMYLGSDDVPEMHVYTIGNPILAQTMLKHRPLSGLYVPLRLMIMGKYADGNLGTIVIYDLPSSMIATDDRGELREAAEVLDRKLEALVQEVTSAACRV